MISRHQNGRDCRNQHLDTIIIMIECAGRCYKYVITPGAFVFLSVSLLLFGGLGVTQFDLSNPTTVPDIGCFLQNGDQLDHRNMDKFTNAISDRIFCLHHRQTLECTLKSQCSHRELCHIGQITTLASNTGPSKTCERRPAENTPG